MRALLVAAGLVLAGVISPSSGSGDGQGGVATPAPIGEVTLPLLDFDFTTQEPGPATRAQMDSLATALGAPEIAQLRILLRVIAQDPEIAERRAGALLRYLVGRRSDLAARIVARAGRGGEPRIEVIGLGQDAPELAVQRLAEDLACSRLEVTPGPDGPRLSGRVANLAALHDRLADLDRLGLRRPASLVVEELPAPFCLVMEMLEARGLPPGGLRLMPDKPDGRYRIGEAIHVDLRIPEGFSGHLTLLYVHPMQIVPMLPSARQPDGWIAAGGTVRIGRPIEEVSAERPGWRITGPPGPGLLVALSTARPVLDLRHPPRSGEEALALLAVVLGGKGGFGPVEAASFLLQVRE